jgi:hypothetical protein
MSDKQLILDAVQRMSESATLDEIREAIAILAAAPCQLCSTDSIW